MPECQVRTSDLLNIDAGNKALHKSFSSERFPNMNFVIQIIITLQNALDYMHENCQVHTLYLLNTEAGNKALHKIFSSEKLSNIIFFIKIILLPFPKCHKLAKFSCKVYLSLEQCVDI